MAASPAVSKSRWQRVSGVELPRYPVEPILDQYTAGTGSSPAAILKPPMPNPFRTEPHIHMVRNLSDWVAPFPR